MDKYDTTKPKNIDYFRLPQELWHLIEPCLPPEPPRQGPGRPRADNRAIWNGIWYHLWTGCQWKAMHRNWFGVCSSMIHHNKWSADDLIISIVLDRPDPQEVEQHFCADKGYDYDDVHQTVAQAHISLSHQSHTSNVGVGAMNP